MDSFDEYLQTIEIKCMPENYRAIRGQRQPGQGPLHADLEAVRGSFAQLNIAFTLPEDGLLLTEERPAFSHRYPLTPYMVLRAALSTDGPQGQLFPVDLTLDDDEVPKADILLSSGSMEVKAWQQNEITLLINHKAY